MVKIATNECGCGKVQFDIKVTTELVTSPVVGCQCIDCIGFVESVEQARTKAHKTGGREHLIEPEKYTLVRPLYKSDIVAIRGSEHLGRLTMSPRLIRYYSKCCGTPMAFLFKNPLPFCALWERNFVAYKGAESMAVNAEPFTPQFRPDVIVFHKFEQPGAKPLPEHVPVGDTAPLSLIFKFATRFLFGCGKGKYRTNPSLFEIGESPIPSGKDAVKFDY